MTSTAPKMTASSRSGSVSVPTITGSTCARILLRLRAALEPFVSAGRQVRGGNRRTPEPAPRQQGIAVLDFPRQQRLAIRKWARDNGYDVADRGAFSQEVLAAYQEANEEAEAAR